VRYDADGTAGAAPRYTGMHRLAAGMLLLTMAAAIILPGPDRHTRDHAFSGCRWPSARIAYTDDTGRYGRATAAAARHWTFSAAAVQLHAVPAAAWTVTMANLGPTQVYGLTRWTCERGRFASVISYYNTYYTDGFTFEQRVSLMTHEMGHGLGLSHGTPGAAATKPGRSRPTSTGSTSSTEALRASRPDRRREARSAQEGIPG